MDKKKILVIDDEPDILKLTSLRLRKLGYDVLTAIDGEKGFESIRNEKPDLVLLDLMLPVMSGIDVFRKTKNDEELKNIPIILFTASCNTITAEKTKMLGAQGYIIKPFDPEELINKVKCLLTEGVVP